MNECMPLAFGSSDLSLVTCCWYTISLIRIYTALSTQFSWISFANYRPHVRYNAAATVQSKHSYRPVLQLMMDIVLNFWHHVVFLCLIDNLDTKIWAWEYTSFSCAVYISWRAINTTYLTLYINLGTHGSTDHDRCVTWTMNIHSVHMWLSTALQSENYIKNMIL